MSEAPTNGNGNGAHAAEDDPELHEEHDLAHALEVVLANQSRSFQCKGCGRWAQVSVTLGPAQWRFPSRCEECEPRSRTWVREREARPLRALIRHLAAQLDEARGPVWPPVTSRRAERYGEPGREAFTRAVRAVVAAKDSDHALREAVLDLASVAQAYARQLNEGRGRFYP